MSRSLLLGENKIEHQFTQDVLDLSGKGLKKMDSLPKRTSLCKLVLDNNNITKIEKLDVFPKLCYLSIASNHLVRMNGVNFGKNLTTINLSNNGIVSMEGLCWLIHLEQLDLSKNNIKRIENVSYCTKLKYMDLSENSITDVSDLSNLVHLKVLLLHGNAITALQRAEGNLPELLETLSLADNGIADLNEVRHLTGLSCLKHLSIQNNPCVMMTSSVPGFDYRPFILFCCPALSSLDGFVVTDTERNDAECLKRDENLSLFLVGHHIQLVLYLNKICPLTTTTPQPHEDQQKFLDNFLEIQRLQTKRKPDIYDNAHSFMNEDHEPIKTSDSRLGRTPEYSNLDQSSVRVRLTPECSRNDLTSSTDEEEDERDLLCSESSFLPVYSPLKNSVQQSIGDNRDCPTDSEQSVTWEELLNQESVPDDEDFPIMTEEEANKLIHLAATILQAHIRGFLVRRKFDFKNFKRKHNAASKIQACWKGYYFRHRSYQGLNFKHELRIQRLQKYVATLCIMMQKAEKQHEVEKQHLLEAVHLLYDKFTELSGKVEQQTAENNNERSRLERNAAVVLQKHWRGFAVRKVNYLESLVMKTDQRESDIYIRGQLDPAFLPHPRLFGPDEQHEKEEFKVVNVNQDIQERESTEYYPPAFGHGEMGSLKDKEEYMLTIKDENEIVEDKFEGVTLDGKELKLLHNEVDMKKDEKLEDKEEERGKDINETCDGEQFRTKVMDKHPHGNVESLIIQNVDEESNENEGKKKNENEKIEERMVNDVEEGICEDDEGIVDTSVDNLLEKEEFQTEVDGRGVSDDQEVKGGVAGEPESQEDHSYEVVNFRELQDNKDEKIEVIKDWSIEKDGEHSGESGDSGKVVEMKDDRRTDDAAKNVSECTSINELQNVTSKADESPSLDERNNTLDVEHFKASSDPQKACAEIAKNVEVPVQNSDVSDLGSSDDQGGEVRNKESYPGDTEQECSMENASTTETDIKHVSPRLGQRASNLLSALKTEISKVSLQSSNTDESSSALGVSYASSSDTEKAVSVENIDSSSGHATVSSDGEETLSVND